MKFTRGTYIFDVDAIARHNPSDRGLMRINGQSASEVLYPYEFELLRDLYHVPVISIKELFERQHRSAAVLEKRFRKSMNDNKQMELL